MKTNSIELSESKLKDLKTAMCKDLSHIRHMLLIKYPFIGSIALRMDLIPIRDARVRTACTDGKDVYFDISFFNSLSHDERTFVLAHEIWHAVLMHLVRCGTRIPSLFNIATDKEVNYMLSQDGLIPPKMVCMPESHEQGKCAEEIYAMMLKNVNKMFSSSGSGGSDSSASNSANDNDNGNGPCGQFDKHLYDNMDNDDGKDSDVTDEYGKVGCDPDFKPHISKDFADKMREIIISEAQRCERMQKGSLPGHLKELISNITKPEIKWQEILAQFVTRAYHSGRRTWIPPNRRHIHRGLYVQRQESTKINLALIIDTSGSTMGDRNTFFTELTSLVKSFGCFNLTVLDVDAEVNDVRHYTQDDNLESELENGTFTMSGGGGTAMTPGFKYILDNQIECDAIVCLTDGYIDTIDNNPTSLPTLWIITKDGTDNFCDWGEKIRLKHNDSDYE